MRSNLKNDLRIIIYMKEIQKLQTGDILLFHCAKSWSPFSLVNQFINWATESKYSHVAMVLKNPTYIDPKLKGLYLLESSMENVGDAEDGRIKFGVQISPFHDVVNSYKGDIYVRHLYTNRDSEFEQKLTEVHKEVHNKTYDMHDFITSFERERGYDCWKNTKVQRTDSFMCSSLIAFVYSKLGLLDTKTPWSLVYPKEFSTECPGLKFHCVLDVEKKLN